MTQTRTRTRTRNRTPAKGKPSPQPAPGKDAKGATADLATVDGRLQRKLAFFRDQIAQVSREQAELKAFKERLTAQVQALWKQAGLSAYTSVAFPDGTLAAFQSRNVTYAKARLLESMVSHGISMTIANKVIEEARKETPFFTVTWHPAKGE